MLKSSAGHAAKVQVPGETLAEWLFHELKREIVENRLLPESLLTELSVAAGYGVSRAPAREALKRLSTLGFLRPRQRVGYLVTNVSLADMEEIFAMRMELEPLATELAVGRLTERDSEVLEGLAHGVLRVAEEPVETHGRLLSRLNADFHREIARIAGNRRLERSIAGLVDELERVMHMLAESAMVEAVLDEHLQLLQVMKAGRASEARALMREQLQHDYAVMRALVANSRSGVTLERTGASANSSPARQT